MHVFTQLIPSDGAALGKLDIFAVKDRLHDLFSRYGQVRRLDIVRADQGGARRVMCFLRMSTPEEEQALMGALGMGRFGGDLVMVVALDEQADTAQPWMQPGLGVGASSGSAGLR